MFSLLAQTSGTTVPTPTQTWWVGTFLLMIVWLFVAAVILGPLIHYFSLIRPSKQHFADDRKTH